MDNTEEFLGLIERLRLSDAAAGALVGISAHTVRIVRISRKAPAYRRCREAIDRFVALNRGVERRDQLRLVA